jgi:hypothetical protein
VEALAAPDRGVINLMDQNHYLIFIILLIIACGGGGGKYYPPQIVINKIGLTKEEIKSTKTNFKAKVILEVDLDREDTPNKYIKGVQYYYFSDFQFKNEKYKLAVPIKNFISIIDSKGEVIKKLETPRYTTNAAAFELIDSSETRYLAVFIEQQATSHSSTLYILNDHMEIVYKEHLLGALWMAIENSKNGENLIVSAETQWIQKNKWISVGGPWRYMFTY